jgi:hypothetical protein
MARRRVEAAHSPGDALFLGASSLSAGFTVPMSRAKLDPLHAAALVSTGSLALYGPLYLAFCGARLARLPARPSAGAGAVERVHVEVRGDLQQPISHQRSVRVPGENLQQVEPRSLPAAPRARILILHRNH